MPKRSKARGSEKNGHIPKPGGRFEKHEGGAVPQTTLSPKDRLNYLDTKGFVAKKERAKCALRIIEAAKKPKPKAKDKKKEKKK